MTNELREEMKAAPTITCVGHAAFDLIYRVDAIPVRPVKVPARSLAMSGGGMAANAACAIRRLGGAVRFVGPVGEDVFGQRVVAELVEFGVDTRWLPRVCDATTSVSSIVVDASGERLIVNHRGTALDAAAPAMAPVLAGAAALLCDVRWPAGARAAFAAARAIGVPAVLDADTADGATLGELVPLANHVIFSEPGFARWCGLAAEAPDAPERLVALVDGHCALAAVTLGERGVLYATERGVARLPAYPVDAVETLGAGDVFHGAFTLALAEGMAIPDALRFASAAAAEKCRRAGGRAGLPTRTEAEARLRS
jgi:sulfofructose kinase